MNAMKDIADFHIKFGFDQPDKPGFIADHKMAMRLNFLLEELLETADAAGYTLQRRIDNDVIVMIRDNKVAFVLDDEKQDKKDLAKFMDGLIDLNYVSYGFAWLCNLPYEEGWRRVQAANMAKVRCENAADSKRGTTFDVIKPEGWVGPTFNDILFY